MLDMSLGNTRVNRGFETDKILIIFGVQALLFDKLPHALDEIEIGGIGR